MTGPSSYPGASYPGASPDIDAVLDVGAAGLRFFVEFLPRAHRIGMASTVTVPYLTDRYEAQRGLDVARLASDADVVRTLSAVVGSSAVEQRDRFGALPVAWESDASLSASEQLAAHLERADRLHETVGVLADTLAGAAIAIGTIVDEKARAAVGFADPVICGLGPADVDAVLAGASGAGSGPAVAALARRSGGVAADADAAEVAQWCVRWLDEVFGPGIEAAVDAFVGLCDDTDLAVGAVFDTLADVFEDLDQHRFPGVGAGLPPAGGHGEIVPAWGSPGASSADVVRAGVSLVESGLELAAAVGELTGAVVGLATAVVEGATSVVEGATTVVEGATAGVEGATAGVEGATAGVEGATAGVEGATAGVEGATTGETAAGPVPESHTAPVAPEGPAGGEPGPVSAAQSAPHGEAPRTDSAVEDSAVEDPAAENSGEPSQPLGSGGAGPAGAPAPATGRGRGGHAGEGRTGTVPTDERDPVEPSEPIPDGGVTLAEAGPL